MNITAFGGNGNTKQGAGHHLIDLIDRQLLRLLAGINFNLFQFEDINLVSQYSQEAFTITTKKLMGDAFLCQSTPEEADYAAMAKEKRLTSFT